MQRTKRLYCLRAQNRRRTTEEGVQCDNAIAGKVWARAKFSSTISPEPQFGTRPYSASAYLPPVFWGTTISFRARSGLLEGGDVVGYEASSRLLSARLTGAEMFMQVGPVAKEHHRQGPRQRRV